MKKAIIITIIIFIAILLVILVWAWVKGRQRENTPTINPPDTSTNPTPPNNTPQPPYTSPVPIDPVNILGKRAYGGDNVKIYTGPAVDQGYWWDFTGLSSTVMCQAPDGDIVTAVTQGSQNNNELWYEIQINFEVCTGNRGYVKANEVTLK